MQLHAAAWVALTGPKPDLAPRPWETIEHDLLAARRAGVVDVRFGGVGEPVASPHLLRALRRARELGLRPLLVTDGVALATAGRLDAVHTAGARGVFVRLHGPDADRHDAVAGAGTFRRATATLTALAGHALDGAALVVLTPASLTEVEGFVALARALGVSLRLAGRDGPGPSPCPPPPPAVVAALDLAWSAAARLGVRLAADDLAWTPLPQVSAAAPASLDPNLLTLFEAGARPPSAAIATRLGDAEGLHDVGTVGLALSAAGAPAVDLPACLGGRDLDGPDGRHPQDGCAPCPRADRCAGVPDALADRVTVAPLPAWSGLPAGARVAVLWPWVHDRLLVASTLPALAAALQARGVDARLLGPWDLDFDPHDLAATVHHGRLARAWSFVYRTVTRRPDPLANYRPPEGSLGHPFRHGVDEARAVQVDAAWWRSLDLSAYDVVIAPGYLHGRRAVEHPTLRADARVVIADFHLLDGAQAWRADRTPAGATPEQATTATWWPGDRVTVHSCFPRFEHLYRAAGVPLRQVHWRPYPILGTHAAPGPAPATCAAIFSGGRHARDFPTLHAAATSLAGRVHPIRVHAEPGAVGPPRPPLELLGMAELPQFVDTIRTSRFVVLPLVHDVDHAAGISVAALALAAGRPVVATATPAMVDHLRDDVDSLLVPVGDADALAHAILRLDTDAALLDRLAAGARASGLRLSVEAWATELLHGTAPVAGHLAPGANAGTVYAW